MTQVLSVTLGTKYSDLPLEAAVLDALIYARDCAKAAGLEDLYACTHAVLTKIQIAEYRDYFPVLAEWEDMQDG